MLHITAEIIANFPGTENTTYLIRAEKEGKPVYVINATSHWRSRPTWNYLFDANGNFVFSYTGGNPESIYKNMRRERITKKNRKEISAQVLKEINAREKVSV